MLIIKRLRLPQPGLGDPGPFRFFYILFIIRYRHYPLYRQRRFSCPCPIKRICLFAAAVLALVLGLVLVVAVLGLALVVLVLGLVILVLVVLVVHFKTS